MLLEEARQISPSISKSKLKQFEDFSNHFKVPTVIHDLLAIHRDYKIKELSFKDEEDFCLLVETNITISFCDHKFKMGKYEIAFKGYDYVEVYNTKGKFKNYEYVHPHIDDGMVCLGQGNEMFYERLKHYQFYDALLIMISVLSSFNSKDPYLSLDNFYPSAAKLFCASCGDVETIEKCSICHKTTCSDCLEEIPRKIAGGTTETVLICNDCLRTKSKLCEECDSRYLGRGKCPNCREEK